MACPSSVSKVGEVQQYTNEPHPRGSAAACGCGAASQRRLLKSSSQACKQAIDWTGPREVSTCSVTHNAAEAPCLDDPVSSWQTSSLQASRDLLHRRLATLPQVEQYDVMGAHLPVPILNLHMLQLCHGIRDLPVFSCKFALASLPTA